MVFSLAKQGLMLLSDREHSQIGNIAQFGNIAQTGTMISQPNENVSQMGMFPIWLLCMSYGKPCCVCAS